MTVIEALIHMADEESEFTGQQAVIVGLSEILDDLLGKLGLEVEVRDRFCHCGTWTMTDNGDPFCATEGSGILDHYREETEKSNQDKAQREAVAALRSLREEIDSGNLEQWRALEKAKRVMDELFGVMGW